MKNVKIFREGHIINISSGNCKMGRVFSFSLPAVVTCAKGVPCGKDCYACKFRESAKRCYRENLDAVKSLPTNVVINTISDYIHAKGVRLFRWNVSGDFASEGVFTPIYWRIACEVAKRCPGTLFLAFTKVFACFEQERPANFNLVASVWNDYAPEDGVDNKPSAHFCDGTRDMPSHAVECSGECETCMLCFGLRPGEAVYFVKH